MEQGTKFFSDGRCTIVVDERHKPLHVVTWMGPPAEGPVRQYFDWSTQLVHEARKSGRSFAIVADTSQGDRPDPKMRALMAELSDGMPRAEDLITVYVAIPSALVRGAITAMQWLTRKRWPIEIVPSLAEGLKRATATLAARGAPLPAGFDAARYHRPRGEA